MSQYRKRFVQFNMLLIGIVLTVVVAAVAVYVGKNEYTGLKITMEQVVAPLRAFSQPPSERYGEQPKSKPDRKDNVKDKDIMTVFYSAQEGSYALLSPSDSFSEDSVQELLDTVVAQNQDFGILYGMHAIYYRSGTNPYKIAIASTGYLTHSYLRLALVLLAIWLGAMVLFLVISIRLSAIAARPMEEAMQREKQFVADASHDLKTPLSVILANNAILRENPEATVDSLGRWLDSTQAAAERMRQLIGQMLTLADVERPDAPLEIETVDLANIAMKAELELESLAYEKNVRLDTDLPDECLIRGNADYLLRIVGSLLENALKYEPGGGWVLLALTREKKKAVLSVKNQGSQIPQEDIPHVFERFYRSDKSRKNETGSFGLGLAITKEMTEKLGGKISVESGKEGTTFRVAWNTAAGK